MPGFLRKIHMLGRVRSPMPEVVVTFMEKRSNFSPKSRNNVYCRCFISSMKAVVITKSCEASDLRVSDVSVPKVKPGWVLIRVKAFGINHSEVLLR